MYMISEPSLHERTSGFFENGGKFAAACASLPFPFEIRPQQQKMALAVADALADSEHLAVEAGTGVGKTFAYLVPLILSAVKNEHHASRVAVSTHTINLQEQLMFKDIPFLQENMGVDFKAALCKGRHNYICRRRLESANLMSGDLFNKGAEKELARIKRWAEKTDDGSAHRSSPQASGGGSLSDFSEDDAQPAMAVWRQVCSEHDNCLGKKCHYYARCFLMRARAEAFNANLLVLNHHLLFSDLALRQTGNGILPDCRALVLDEAHNIEDVAGEHLGLRLSQGGIQHWLRRLYTPAGGKGLLMALKEFQIADETARTWDAVDHFFIELGNYLVIPDLTRLGRASSEAWVGNPENLKLDSRLPGFAGALRRGERGNDRRRDKLTIKGRLELKSLLAEQIGALLGHIKKLHEAIEDESVKAELKAIITRGDEIRQAIEFFRKEPDPNFVYWIENEGGGPATPTAWPAKPREACQAFRMARGKLALVSAPIDVAPLLKDLLFNSFAPVVLTSATLAAGGSLEFFKKRIGADHCRELVAGSPFNYQRQMKVFIAENMPGPNDETFPEAAAKAVAHFVRKTGGKAFVLFTNAELMRKVAASLEGFFAEEGLLALVQGDGLPRHVMLKKFRDAHDQAEMQNGNDKLDCDDLQSKIQNSQPQAGPPAAEKSKIGSAVLFGLDSFWMGVDVRGEALSNVIIVRLPFAVPDEPLVKARIDLLTAEGKDAFREYSLPQAILKFRQGVGRLIRTASDEGIIAILDSRIISRWYGKYFLQAIPECPVEPVSLPEV